MHKIIGDLEVSRQVQPGRLSTTDRDAIAAPDDYGIIWHVDAAQFEYWDGAAWQPLTGGASGGAITLTDTTADANHTQDFAGFDQTWNNIGSFAARSDAGATTTGLNVTPSVGSIFYIDAGGEEAAVITQAGGEIQLSGGHVLLERTPSGAGVNDAPVLEFQTDTGANTVGLRAPDGLASSYTLTFPADTGAAGEVLSTDGTGVLSWAPAGGGINVVDTFPDLPFGSLVTGEDYLVRNNGTLLRATSASTLNQLITASAEQAAILATGTVVDADVNPDGSTGGLQWLAQASTGPGPYTVNAPVSIPGGSSFALQLRNDTAAPVTWNLDPVYVGADGTPLGSITVAAGEQAQLHTEAEGDPSFNGNLFRATNYLAVGGNDRWTAEIACYEDPALNGPNQNTGITIDPYTATGAAQPFATPYDGGTINFAGAGTITSQTLPAAVTTFLNTPTDLTGYSLDAGTGNFNINTDGLDSGTGPVWAVFSIANGSTVSAGPGEASGTVVGGSAAGLVFTADGSGPGGVMMIELTSTSFSLLSGWTSNDPAAAVSIVANYSPGAYEYSVITLDDGSQEGWDPNTDTLVDISGGIPGTWVACTAVGGDNLAIADLTADATHTHDFAGFDQYWNNLNVFSVGATGFVGLGANPNATEGYGVTANGFSQTATLFGGPNTGQNQVIVNPLTINLDFNATSDLQVDGAAGAAGEVLTSQGSGLPPVWAAGGGGGGSNLFDADDTLSTSRAHTLTSTGSFVMNGADSSVIGFAVGASQNYGLTMNGMAGTEVVSLVGNTQSISLTDSDMNISAGNGISVAMTSALRVNGNTGTSGQVLTSNGPTSAPTWETPSGGSGDNIQTADLSVQTAARTHDFGNFNQTWNNLLQLDVNAENAIQFRTDGFVGEGRVDVEDGIVQITGGPDPYPTGAGYGEVTVSYTGSDAGYVVLHGHGPTVAEEARIRASYNSGIAIDFPATNGDLEIDGDAGTAGQVLTSNGASNPPSWQTAGGITETILNQIGTNDAGYMEFGQHLVQWGRIPSTWSGTFNHEQTFHTPFASANFAVFIQPEVVARVAYTTFQDPTFFRFEGRDVAGGVQINWTGRWFAIGEKP